MLSLLRSLQAQSAARHNKPRCLPMPASSFTNASNATTCWGHKLVIVASFAPMLMSNAHRSKNTQLLKMRLMSTDHYRSAELSPSYARNLPNVPHIVGSQGDSIL